MRRHSKHLLMRFAAMLAIVAFASPKISSAAAVTPSDKFVRTANYYLKAGIGIPSSDYDKLANYDVLVLPAEAQVFNKDLFAEVRRKNPNIILLAYVPTKSYALVWSDPLHDALKSGIKDEWRLRDAAGNNLTVWPNTYALNLASGWSDYLAHFTVDKVLSTGAWDGVFFDEASATISWLNGGNLDLDRDGIKDDAATADRLWKAGMINLLKTTRTLAGNGAYIVMNGDSDADLQSYTNGRMFETFPTPWEAGGSWSAVEGNYLKLQQQVTAPPLFIINGNTNNTGAQTDYRKVRFGLASALLGDGYFGFDFGDQDHGQIWMYDEYNAYLGKPLGPPKNLIGSSDAMRPGLWQRDFEHGIVLVNSTDKTQTADFTGDFEHLHGTQDPNVNNGEVVNSVDVPPSDGAILLRPLDKLTGASYRNGAFIRVFNGDGQVQRTGFFSYTNRQRGGTIVAQFDVPSLGPDSMLIAKGNRLEAYDGSGILRQTVYPFGQDWKTSIGFSIGKAGGRAFVAVAAGPGASPRVRVYDENLNPVSDAWDAYSPKFRGGVNVAVGDFDGNGEPTLVTGAGPGGGPHVRIFDLQQRLKTQFYAYPAGFHGGVNVGIGDVDGSGQAEIITGTGFGGSPQVRVFDRKGKMKNQFFAFDSKKRGGVRVAAVDIDGNGRYQILAMSNDVFTSL